MSATCSICERPMDLVRASRTFLCGSTACAIAKREKISLEDATKRVEANRTERGKREAATNSRFNDYVVTTLLNSGHANLSYATAKLLADRITLGLELVRGREES